MAQQIQQSRTLPDHRIDVVLLANLFVQVCVFGFKPGPRRGDVLVGLHRERNLVRGGLQEFGVGLGILRLFIADDVDDPYTLAAYNQGNRAERSYAFSVGPFFRREFPFRVHVQAQ